ncbi:MAG: hypothetical protein ACJA1A_000306 [Saprospiraceae bacterium]|jgi:hypothetical protein|tara:strand:- start:209 stop:643 length:435 start_codon:yes stop_codon:yes gene_type:complete
MKKIIYTLLCFALFSTIVSGQLEFGIGATYLNNLGVQVRADIPLIDGFDVEPKVSYYFVDNATVLSFDADATYDLINFGDSNPFYLLVGPTLYRTSTSGFSDSNLGFNLGAGLGISNLVFEIKYTTLFCDNCNGQVGGNVAYMF